MPRAAAVAAVHDGRVGHALGVDVLCGEYEGAVAHGDAAPGPLKQEVPLGTFHLSGDVYGLAPCLAVIVAVCQYKLSRHVGIHPLCRVVPCHAVAHAMTPRRHDPCTLCRGVVEYRGVSHAILRRGKRALVGKAQRQTHTLPCAAAVGAAAQPDVDMLLEILRGVVAHVVDGEQRSARGGDKARYAVCGGAVITCMSYAYGHAVRLSGTADGLECTFRTIYGDRTDRGRELVCEGCIMLHADAYPQVVYAAEKLLAHVETDRSGALVERQQLAV